MKESIVSGDGETGKSDASRGEIPTKSILRYGIKAFMSNWLSGNEEQKGENNQPYIDSLKALYAKAQKVSKDVREIENSLLDSYAPAALSNLSRRFEKISKEFTNYTLIRSNVFHEIIHRSASRLSAVQGIAEEAKKVAKIFETYARAPDSYSASDSRIEINKLQAEFVNLKDASTPDKLNS